MTAHRQSVATSGIGSETPYADLSPDIATVFMVPPREIADVSSSFVKGLVGPKGWQQIVKQYLPSPVYKAFLDHYTNGRHRAESGGLKEMSERS